MSNRKQRLELTWIGKDERPRLEPRILLEDAELSCHANTRVTDEDIFDNILIQGDNLLALKAIEQEYSGKIKCIYIDPPYNTGNAFETYDDGLEHSTWLSLMRDRLEMLHRLLSIDGIFCCQIDDAEGAYLNVLLDEVFGRDNQLTTFYIQVRYGNKTLAEDNAFQKVIERCFVYAKDRTRASPIKDVEPYKIEKFEWQIAELTTGKVIEAGRKKVTVFREGEYEIKKVSPHLAGLKETWATGSLVRQTGSSGEFLDKHLVPRKEVDGLCCLYKVEGIGEDGLGYRYMTGPKKATATKGKFYSGIPLQTLDDLKAGNSEKAKPIQNFYDFAGAFGNCRHEGGVDFRGGKKPEALISLILKHFSREGDWVLDSFAGSGTTGAVAHKMRRRWIMVELGEHCNTLCHPRLSRVVTGTDKTGVTEEYDWMGGGGFRYYRLAPSLLAKDAWGNWVISKDFDSAKLAHAVCKLMGFRYHPDETHYWMQGRSSETDFIYVTTQSLTRSQLVALSEEVGDERSLLVCCKAFRTDPDAFPNLTIRKIPQAVLRKCEWGKDDYSLNVANLPETPRESDDPGPTPEADEKRGYGKATSQNDLFSQGGGK